MKLLYKEPNECKEGNSIENKSVVAGSQKQELKELCFHENLNRAYDILFNEVNQNKNLWKSQDQ